MSHKECISLVSELLPYAIADLQEHGYAPDENDLIKRAHKFMDEKDNQETELRLAAKRMGGINGLTYEQYSKEIDKAYDSAVFVGITNELHNRLSIQARNLLLEYRLSQGKSVPVEKVEALMKLYGNLIAKLIWDNQRGVNAKD